MAVKATAPTAAHECARPHSLQATAQPPHTDTGGRRCERKPSFIANEHTNPNLHLHITYSHTRASHVHATQIYQIEHLVDAQSALSTLLTHTGCMWALPAVHAPALAPASEQPQVGSGSSSQWAAPKVSSSAGNAAAFSRYLATRHAATFAPGFLESRQVRKHGCNPVRVCAWVQPRVCAS